MFDGQVSSIVVFGTLASHGTFGGVSVYNGEDPPLHFAMGIGIFSFVVVLLLAGLFAVDQVAAA